MYLRYEKLKIERKRGTKRTTETYSVVQKSDGTSSIYICLSNSGLI